MSRTYKIILVDSELQNRAGEAGFSVNADDVDLEYAQEPEDANNVGPTVYNFYTVDPDDDDIHTTVAYVPYKLVKAIIS